MPTVSLVTEGFIRQAAATGRGLGFDGMPLAVLRGHVDSQSHDEMIAGLLGARNGLAPRSRAKSATRSENFWS